MMENIMLIRTALWDLNLTIRHERLGSDAPYETRERDHVHPHRHHRLLAGTCQYEDVCFSLDKRPKKAKCSPHSTRQTQSLTTLSIPQTKATIAHMSSQPMRCILTRIHILTTNTGRIKLSRTALATGQSEQSRRNRQRMKSY